jgi:plastocyanin
MAFSGGTTRQEGKMMELVGSALRVPVVRYVIGGAVVATLIAGASTARADTFEVGTAGNSWDPDLVEAQTGDTVNWTFTSLHNLNLLDPEGGAILTDEPPSGTTSHLFDVAGDYVYYCSIHGSPTFGMRGQVQVTDSGPDPVPALDVTAPRKATVKAGKTAKLRVGVESTGEIAANGVDVCVKVSRRLAAIRGDECRALGSLPPSEEANATLSVKPKSKAAGKKVKVTFTATADGAEEANATTTLKVKR